MSLTRRSIQNKLLTALVVLLLVVVVSSSITWFAFGRVETQQQVLLEKFLPTLYATDEVVNAGVDLLNIGDALSRPISPKELSDLSAKVEQLILQVTKDLNDLGNQHVFAGGLALLIRETEPLIASISQQLSLQKNLTNKRQLINEEINTIASISDALLVDIKIVISEISLELLEQDSLDQSNKDRLQYQISSLMELRFDVQNMMSLLDHASVSDTVKGVVSDQLQYRAWLKKVGLKFSSLDLVYRQRLVSNSVKLHEAFLKPTNIFDYSEEQAKLYQSLSELQANNLLVNQQLRKHYQEISTQTRQELDLEANRILSITRVSVWILTLSALASVLIVILLFQFFIKPKIITRISRLTQTTRSIANGHYDLAIDTSGYDEISAMALSLSYFRDQLLEKEQVQQSLASRELSLSTIIENAAEGLFTFDSSGEIKTFNPAFESMFGIDRILPAGHSVNFFFPTLVDTFTSDIESKSHNGVVVVKSLQVVAHKVDGKQFFANLSVSLIYLSGEPVYSGFVRDVTMEYESRQRMDQLIEQLSNSNADLEHFAYSCSHDLQEPIRIISSFTDLLVERLADYDDEGVQRYLGFLSTSANDARNMIKSILEYSRLDQTTVSKAPVNMNVVFKRVEHTLSVLLEENNASLEWEDSPSVYAVEGQLFQVILNLVINGLKYNHSAKPTVTLCVIENDSDWIISVEDNGIGIDARYHQKIFELFSRLVSKRDYSGSGIGLAVCQKIIDKHGGNIDVKSKVGQGSCFSLFLPKEELLDIPKASLG